ncbi:hypothetical protein Sliba_51450 [Streptomyces nigrescens]|uniref:Uncharacterized protein n=1 Tax=Streptomyces nigrescens TaxID=1920 RepID=A0A640TP52_STRNI|nr:hypothetical protein Sliba_51450 [Streptomyces libani subsp. libani]
MREATTKSPEKDCPPAGRSAISWCQAGGQLGERALDADAFAQVEEHGAATPPGHPDPAAELGDQQPEEPDRGDDQDRARSDPFRPFVVRAEQGGLDDQRGRGSAVQDEEVGRPQQQSAGDDREDQRRRGDPFRPPECARGDGGYGDEQGGQREPVGALTAEVVDTGLAHADAGPVQTFVHPGRQGFRSLAACHCSGTLSTRSAVRRFAARQAGKFPGNPVRNAVAPPWSVLLGMRHGDGITDAAGRRVGLLVGHAEPGVRRAAPDPGAAGRPA